MEVLHVELSLNTCGAVTAHRQVNCCSVSRCPTDLNVGLRKKCLVLGVVPLLWGGSPPPHPLQLWGHLRAALSLQGTKRSSRLVRISESMFIFGGALPEPACMAAQFVSAGCTGHAGA